MTHYQFFPVGRSTIIRLVCLGWITHTISRLGLFLRHPKILKNLARCTSRGPAENRDKELVACPMSILPRVTIQFRHPIVI